MPRDASAGPCSSAALAALATRFCEETRAKGSCYFGEGADNLTAVLVDLSVLGVASTSEEATQASARVSVAAGRLSNASDIRA